MFWENITITCGNGAGTFKTSNWNNQSGINVESNSSKTGDTWLTKVSEATWTSFMILILPVAPPPGYSVCVSTGWAQIPVKPSCVPTNRGQSCLLHASMQIKANWNHTAAVHFEFPCLFKITGLEVKASDVDRSRRGLTGWLKCCCSFRWACSAEKYRTLLFSFNARWPCRSGDAISQKAESSN